MVLYIPTPGTSVVFMPTGMTGFIYPPLYLCCMYYWLYPILNFPTLISPIEEKKSRVKDISEKGRGFDSPFRNIGIRFFTIYNYTVSVHRGARGVKPALPEFPPIFFLLRFLDILPLLCSWWVLAVAVPVLQPPVEPKKHLRQGLQVSAFCTTVLY